MYYLVQATRLTVNSNTGRRGHAGGHHGRGRSSECFGCAVLGSNAGIELAASGCCDGGCIYLLAAPCDDEDLLRSIKAPTAKDLYCMMRDELFLIKGSRWRVCSQGASSQYITLRRCPSPQLEADGQMIIDLNQSSQSERSLDNRYEASPSSCAMVKPDGVVKPMAALQDENMLVI